MRAGRNWLRQANGPDCVIAEAELKSWQAIRTSLNKVAGRERHPTAEWNRCLALRQSRRLEPGGEERNRQAQKRKSSAKDGLGPRFRTGQD